MANTTTTNYGWQMPDPGYSANTWGNTLNGTTQAIDAQVYQNQQAGVPVGAMAMWPAAAAPTNWLICDGSSLSTATYAALFAIIGYNYGGSGANFNLPNLQTKFPIGVGTGMALAATGGASSTTLAAAQLPAHTHPITQVAHTHTASQPAHVHPDPGHAHTISDPTHTHSASVAIAPGFGIGPNAPSPIMPGGATGVTVSAAATGITGTNAAATGLQAAQPAITVNATTPTGPTATGNNTGSTGAAVPTVPPFVAVNFIIKFA